MPRGRSNEQQETIDRYWRGIPVRDADNGIYIVISGEDVEGAVPGDPENCAIALTCRRALHSTAVVIFHRIAYIDTPLPSGKREVLRFRVPPGTARVIEDLDSGKPVQPGRYQLLPPAKTDRLDTRYDDEKRSRKREHDRLWRQRRREARLKGEILPSRGKQRAAGMEGFVRDGTGLVQMTARNNKVAKLPADSDRLIWHGILDKRYLVQVQRTANKPLIILFDTHRNDEIINVDSALSHDDVFEWQKWAIAQVDSYTNG